MLSKFIRELVMLGMESFGRYYSCYRGFVQDSNDPQNLHRVRLIVPEVYGNNVYDYWALPKSLYSGEGYGTQCIPQKGDMVWVEFERGQPSKPIWSYGYRAKGEMPKEADVEDKNCFWFITPKGNVVKINDTKNYIHIKTNNGDYVELNKESISLVTDKKISLGKLNSSDYKGVLGENNEECLDDIRGALEELLKALQLDIAASFGQPFLKYPNLALKLPLIEVTIQALKLKIPKTLSTKITLD